MTYKERAALIQKRIERMHENMRQVESKEPPYDQYDDVNRASTILYYKTEIAILETLLIAASQARA